MEALMSGLEQDTDTYIDDIGCFSPEQNSKQAEWDHHVNLLDQVLRRLQVQDNNFTINPLKCEWAVKETD